MSDPHMSLTLKLPYKQVFSAINQEETLVNLTDAVQPLHSITMHGTFLSNYCYACGLLI